MERLNMESVLRFQPASIREMILPGLVAVLVPVAFGFLPKFMPESWGLAGNTNALMLGGLLAGVTVSGVLMALFQSNAGAPGITPKK